MEARICQCCGIAIERPLKGAGPPRKRCLDCNIAYVQGYRAGVKKRLRARKAESENEG